MTVCKFFLEGRCRFGQNCRYEHSTSGQNQNVFRLNNQQDSQQYLIGSSQQPQRHLGHQTTQQGFGNQQRTLNQGDNQGDPAIKNFIHVVKEDALTWQKSGQWLFSCYAPLLRRATRVPNNPNAENLPGFEDYSPEELRWEAMASHASGNFQGYAQNLQELAQKYENLQRGLQTMDQATANFIIRYERGENVSPAGIFAGALSSQNQGPASSTSANFSFRLPQSPPDSPASPAASTFRFQLTNQQGQSFGQAPQSPFGSPASNQSAFGNKPVQSPFAASPQSPYGQSPQSLFGRTNQSPFGQGFQQNNFTQLQNQQAAGFQQGPQSQGLFGQQAQSPFGQQTPYIQTPQTTLFGANPANPPIGMPGFNQTTQSPNATLSSESNSKPPFYIDQSTTVDAKALNEFKAEKFTFGKIPRIPPPRELR